MDNREDKQSNFSKIRSKSAFSYMLLGLSSAAVLTLCAFGVFGEKPLTPEKRQKQKLEQVVNKKINIKTGTSHFLEGHLINYNGMNSDTTYSLSYTFDGSNIFYPTNQENIHFREHNFRVDEVKPDRIELTYLGESSWNKDNE
ncbi:hypothetical protein GOV14_05610 [Candidatus Pacearchaeota archaeon]|nr:hypothetical protein [Candidatus Pacearchaeota archaeon]